MKRKQPSNSPETPSSHSPSPSTHISSSKTDTSPTPTNTETKNQEPDQETEKEKEKEKEMFSQAKAIKDHCFYCFDTLVTHFQGKTPILPSFENHECPLFVSWHKKDSKSSEFNLRGCIGTFSSTKIHEGLKNYAISSAIKDSRFSPMKKSEMSSLKCSVSLLTNFEEVDSIYDWEPGTHGVWIEFEDFNGKKRHATFLPEIASELGWTREETLRSLVKKAGCKDASFGALASRIKLTRYTSSKCSATFQEYEKERAKE